MKSYKKIVMIVIILMLSTVLSANIKTYAAVYANEAGNTEVVLKSSATTIKAGETVIITLSVKCKTGIEGLDSTLEYDKTKLSKKSEESLNEFQSLSGEDVATGKYKLSLIFIGNSAPTEADIVKLTFEALETVKIDEVLSVKLTDIEIGDSEDDWFDVTDAETKLTVVGEQQKPDDEKQDPDEGTQKPDDDTQDPDEGTQKPDDDTQDPDEGTQKPDDEKKDPDEGTQKPDDEKQDPDEGTQKPDDNKQDTNKDEPKKDDTQANKPLNNAGTTSTIAIVMLGIVIISAIFYIKYKKYEGIR